MRALLRELGVIEGFGRDGRAVYDERHLCHAPQERLFIHGRWQEGVFPTLGASGEDRAQLEAFRREMERYRRWRDAAGRARSPRRGRPAPRRVPGARLGLDGRVPDRAGFTSPRLRWWVEYACRDDFGTDLAGTSAWAGVHYYAGRDPDPEYGDVVLTWPEGNGWLTRQLAEPVAGRIRLGQLVINVEPAGDGAVVETFDAREGTDAAAPRARGGAGVFRSSSPRALYRPWRERPPAFVSAFHYAPWLVANLHLDRPPAAMSGAPLAWDNVLYDSDGLGYVVATHQSLRTHAGATVLTYYRPFPGPSPDRARRRCWTHRGRRCARASCATWPAPHPGLARDVRRLDIMRYGHAMVRPEVGFVCGAALAAAAGALAGPVHLAHADLSGFSIFEEAFEVGQPGRRAHPRSPATILLDAPARDALGCEKCQARPTTYRAGNRPSLPTTRPGGSLRHRPAMCLAGSRRQPRPRTPRAGGRRAAPAPRRRPEPPAPCARAGACGHAAASPRAWWRRHPWAIVWRSSSWRPSPSSSSRVLDESGYDRLLAPIEWALAALFVAALVAAVPADRAALGGAHRARGRRRRWSCSSSCLATDPRHAGSHPVPGARRRRSWRARRGERAGVVGAAARRTTPRGAAAPPHRAGATRCAAPG